MKTTDPKITAAAAATRNVTTRRRLKALKLSDRQIDIRVKSGLLVPLHRGVFLVGGGEPDFHQQALAAAWAADGYVSGLCAAALFKMRRMEEGDIEVTVPPERRVRLEGALVHRSVLASADRSSFLEIPVTRPARVLFDIADRVEPKVLAGALDHCLVKRLTTLLIVDQMLRGAQGPARARTALLRALVDERLAGQRPTESPLEDDLFDVIDQARLPQPVRQLELPLPGGGKARFDGGYPDERVGLEADGNEHHAGLSDRHRDQKRDQACRIAGWEVLRFTTEEVRERPQQVVERIRAALAARAA